jgi:hypothetical protein
VCEKSDQYFTVDVVGRVVGMPVWRDEMYGEGEMGGAV